MTDTLQAIIGGALERLSQQIRTDLPPVIAAIVILLFALLVARVSRWIVARLFKGIELDRWLRRSGVSAMIDRSGNLRASYMVAQCVFWGILLLGILVALNAFGTGITTRIVESAVFLFPRLLAGGLIVLGGMWLGQYFGRSVLVWAVNEDLPSPRKLAMAVRVLIVFAAVVVAADTIDFARGVLLTAFVMILGGAVLAISLALGLGARDAVKRYLLEHTSQTQSIQERHERSLWNHL
jgi:hypothetical protein